MKEQLKEGFESLRETFDKVTAPLSGSSAQDHHHHSTSSSAHAATSTTSAAATVSDEEPIIRTGDAFRLRSLKFPDYELGVTNVKKRGEYCYLGLRKVCAVHYEAP